MLRTTITTTLLAFFLMPAFNVNAQSIKDLDFLIGTWKVEETIRPGTNEAYMENGTRTCSYYLNDTFIKCEAQTTISTSGRTRHYAYYIRYNERDGYFSAVNFAHDFPRIGQFQWYLNKEAKELRQVAPKNVLGDRFYRAVISYANPDQLIWEGWFSKFSEDKAWQQIFRDVATKVN